MQTLHAARCSNATPTSTRQHVRNCRSRKTIFVRTRGIARFYFEHQVFEPDFGTNLRDRKSGVDPSPSEICIAAGTSGINSLYFQILTATLLVVVNVLGLAFTVRLTFLVNL